MVKMIIYKDEVFGFFEIFNEENGTLFRSDINGVDPVMRSFPELLDVGIMGHCNGGQYCRNAGIDCYQKGFTTYAPHMSYENFMEIVKQAAGKTFQIALGGAGDPNKHPQIEDILKSNGKPVPDKPLPLLCRKTLCRNIMRIAIPNADSPKEDLCCGV